MPVPRQFNRKAVLIVLALLCLVALIRYTVVERPVAGSLTIWVHELFTPGQSGLAVVKQGVQAGIARLSGLALPEQVLELERRVTELEWEKAQTAGNQTEIERLQRILGYRQSNPKYTLIIARVIGRHPSNWFRTVTVDRGQNAGVQKNMVVINPDGLVGKVIEVSSESAEVLLLTDPEGAAGAVVQVSGQEVPGVVEGIGDRTGMLRLRLIPYDATIREGDAVVTSGLGSVFPAGIKIGAVQRVTTDEEELNTLQQASLVAPAVDFHRLQEVMIIQDPGRS